MFPNFRFDETEILCFALVLVRLSAFIVSWPVFSVYSVPNHAKVLFALVVAFVIFPVVDRSGMTSALLSNELIWLVVKEAFIGLCIGFMTRLFFFAVSIGGNLASTSMGLSSGQIFNPTLGEQSSTVEQFYVVFATLIFLAANGHHLFLTGIAESFQIVPLSTLGGPDLAVFKSGGEIVHAVMLAGLQISAPVLVSILFVNLAMGVLGRTVPQINVLITSLPANILAGLAIMIMMLPMFIAEMDDLLTLLTDQMFRMMKAF